MKNSSVKGSESRYAKIAALAAAGMGRGMGRFFRMTPSTVKPRAQVYTVLSITPGRSHAWCDSDQGRIRKPLSSIGADLLNEHRNTVGSIH